MKRILVAYDGSPGAELAVNDLAHGGFDRYAKAKVLTVADVCLPLPATGDGNEVPEPPLVVAARKRVADALLDAKKIAIQGAVLLHQAFPEWEVDNGAKADSPAWGILAEAAAWRADLVVIGSHRHTPLGQ
ncbi:MAG TPA: universal stress protein, partial [Verrucomicrobiae bacterium]|nr:universal stress protein [Verrucomicrobiae bacterium]